MRQAENLQNLEQLKPDFIGFIFYEGSSRFVGFDFQLEGLSRGTKKVGVFVNEEVEKVVALAKKYNLNYVQLHGDEDPSYCVKIKEQGFGILKAVSIGKEYDFESLKPFVDSVDYFLFDTQGKGYGGHGVAFDWAILNNYSLETPFFVAGGISNENVELLLKLKNPKFIGIDVNSKYEISPGLKDISALNELFLKVKQHEI